MATLPACVDEGALLDFMKSSTLTDGWDAVVSYTLDRFNPFLQNSVRSNSSTNPIKLNVDDVALGKKYSINLALGELDPSWKVEGGVLYAVFNVPILSCGYWISTGTTMEEFEDDDESEWRSITPRRFNLELKVHQERIAGKYNHGAEQVKGIARDDSEFLTFGVKTFENEKNDVVVLEFGRGPQSSWSIKANDNSMLSSADEHFLTLASKKVLLGLFSKYPLGFRIIYEDWDNYIEWSNDGKSERKTPVPFTPESFIVTATGCDRGGIISIWVKIAESNNGAGNPQPVSGKVSPDGKTVGQQVCLLPSTKWTSIVFGRQFFLGKIIYERLHAAINKSTATEILASESGFKFNFQYGEDDMYKGYWRGNTPLHSSSHNVEQFNDKIYHFDIDMDGKIKIHRYAECYKNSSVTYKLELSKNFDSPHFRVRDMHIIKPESSIRVTRDDVSILLKSLGWGQHHWNPDTETWRYYLENFDELKIDFPQIGLRPYCNLLANLLSRDVHWENETLKFPHDAVLFGNVEERKPLAPPIAVPPKATGEGGELQPLKGTELGSKRRDRRRGMLEMILHIDLEDEKPVHYFEPFFANEQLLLLFLISAATTSTAILPTIAKKHEMAFPAAGVKDVTRSLLVSPDFDARLIAGTYQIEKPASFLAATVFIDTMSGSPKAWINDHQATSATIMEDGCHFAFTLEVDISQLMNGADPGAGTEPTATTPTGEANEKVSVTVTYAMTFSFPFDSPNRPITFVGTISAPATGKLPAEVQTFCGYQIPSDAYRECVLGHEGVSEWGVVKYLAAEYCLYGVLVWICANGFRISEEPAKEEESGKDPVSLFEIPRNSDAWRRLNSFLGFWNEQKVTEVGDLIVVD